MGFVSHLQGISSGAVYPADTVMNLCRQDGRPVEIVMDLVQLRREHGRDGWYRPERRNMWRFGIGRVLEPCLASMADAADRCIVTSYSDELLVAAREKATLPVAWVLPTWDDVALDRARRLSPDYLFCSLRKLPPDGPLPEGPWHWAVYEVIEPDLALTLAARGARFVETMRIGEMLGDPRLRPGDVDD